MYFWTWNTEEVLNMILWMREFNRSGKGRIEFTGFDMQTPTVAMDLVRTFVTAQDGSYYTTLEPIYQEVSRSAQRGQGGFGVPTATFPLKTVAGKHVKYAGYIKTDGITRGFAGLWWRVYRLVPRTLAENTQHAGESEGRPVLTTESLPALPTRRG
jgi:hypothetical protein